MKFFMQFILILLLIGCAKSEKRITSYVNNNIFTELGSLNEILIRKDIPLNTHGRFMPDILGGVGAGDVEGNFYLLSSDQTIYKLDSLGNIIAELHNVGNGPGEYLEISKFTVDNNLNLYIDDFQHGRILIFDSQFNYVNYIRRDTRSVSSFNDMVFFNNILYCLTVLDNEYGFYQYDINELKLINTCCRPDKKALDYSSFINFGAIDIDLETDEIFYIKPHYYQIFKNEDCQEKEIMNSGSGQFTKIERDVKTIYKATYDYSLLENFFVEDNFFLIKYSARSKGHGNYDIIGRDGKILKENLPLNLSLSTSDFLIKIGSGKYFTFTYQEDENGELKIIINLFKLNLNIEKI